MNEKEEKELIKLKKTRIKLFKDKKFSACLDRERQHIENLINSRFNFLLVIVSAIIISLATTENVITRLIIFIISTVISILFSITIARAHAKFKILFYLINDKFNNKRFKEHPAKFVDSLVNDIHKKNIFLGNSQKDLIGYYIPLIVSLFLLFLSIIYTSIFIFDIFFISYINCIIKLLFNIIFFVIYFIL